VVGNVLGVRRTTPQGKDPEMASYTASDFCQGHGGGRDCTYSEEADGCLQHGYEFDHGTISYCDGSCAEAREHFTRYLRTRTNWEPTPATNAITLEVYGRDVSYQVTFEGTRAEDRALAYMSARKGLHFAEVYDRPFSFDVFPRMADALYPQCHHGMDLRNCLDPIGEHHFGTRDWERAMGF
jgi:hypothetical protein